MSVFAALKINLKRKRLFRHAMQCAPTSDDYDLIYSNPNARSYKKHLLETVGLLAVLMGYRPFVSMTLSRWREIFCATSLAKKDGYQVYFDDYTAKVYLCKGEYLVYFGHFTVSGIFDSLVKSL